MVDVGENLYIIGGVSSYGSDQKEIHQLSCVSGYCSWTTLTQQLTVARFGLVAIPVDDIFCHPVKTEVSTQQYSDLILPS